MPYDVQDELKYIQVEISNTPFPTDPAYLLHIKQRPLQHSSTQVRCATDVRYSDDGDAQIACLGTHSFVSLYLRVHWPHKAAKHAPYEWYLFHTTVRKSAPILGKPYGDRYRGYKGLHFPTQYVDAQHLASQQFRPIQVSLRLWKRERSARTNYLHEMHVAFTSSHPQKKSTA
ncbi:hypothetical protein OAM67_00675 [bacterium]|nr:hypothetical protein [bacterium]